MKRYLGILTLALLAGAACLVYVPQDESRGQQPYDNDRGYADLDSSYFYNELQPYGYWVSYPAYGYVWIPRDVGYKWRPYTRGHWAWTDYGWTWVSLERWGWIAFHYGRWGWDGRLGWYWVPDVIWGPAWVAWSWGDAHIGWAPLPPGVAYVRGRGFGPHKWNIPGHHWNFVRGRDFMDRSLDRWILPVERNATIVNTTVVRVNIHDRDDRVVNDGVDIGHVQKLTSRTVERLALKEAPSAGEDRVEGGEVVVYKPKVTRNEAAKPEQVIAEDKAAAEVENERAGRLTRIVSSDKGASLKKAHEQEAKLMQDSQETEIVEVQRKAEEEKGKVQNPEEKKKVDSRIKSRIDELKKKHEDEKAELAKRQKAEEEKTKQVTIKK